MQKIIDSDESPDLLLGQALSREVMKAGRRFENWQPAQIEGLKKLSKVQKLRLWLKDNIRSSQQLKNFVELAGISAGESDDEVIYLYVDKGSSMYYVITKGGGGQKTPKHKYVRHG